MPSLGGSMCQASVVADDWVVKGCHIHVEDVELSVSPDHLGGVVFQACFSSTSPRKLAKAIKIAQQTCLPNAEVRKRWIRDVERAILYMLQYEGVLRNLANGRMLEFKFLILALKRYKD